MEGGIQDMYGMGYGLDLQHSPNTIDCARVMVLTQETCQDPEQLQQCWYDWYELSYSCPCLCDLVYWQLASPNSTPGC